MLLNTGMLVKTGAARLGLDSFAIREGCLFFTGVQSRENTLRNQVKTPLYRGAIQTYF